MPVGTVRSRIFRAREAIDERQNTDQRRFGFQMTVDDRDREALSALMDGEAQELELRRSLDAIANDAALRERWRRQQRRAKPFKAGASSAPISISRSAAASLSHRRTLSRNLVEHGHCRVGHLRGRDGWANAHPPERLLRL